jgi:hypothetical protein
MATYTIKGNVGQEKSGISFVAENKVMITPLLVSINDSLDRSAVTRVLRNMAERLRESNTAEPPAAYT